MASSLLARCLRFSKPLSVSRACNVSVRSFVASSPNFHPQRAHGFEQDPEEEEEGRRTKSVIEEDMDELGEHWEEFSEVEDAPSGGHIMLQELRQTLHYLRLIEHEMPKLVAYRKPFIPPTSSTPIIVRCMHYQGESHPAMIKRVIVVPVDQLPLNGEQAIHKIKLLAGPRWTPNPPVDAGVGRDEEYKNGFIKISCENFPKASTNLKWASDTLDNLVEEANNTQDTFSDLPIDMRHVYAKAVKSKKGDHLRNRVFNRPSIKDFPKEWLPPTPAY